LEVLRFITGDIYDVGLIIATFDHLQTALSFNICVAVIIVSKFM